MLIEKRDVPMYDLLQVILRKDILSDVRLSRLGEGRMRLREGAM